MTSYYVQTFECVFPHNWGSNTSSDVDSSNGLLTSFLDGVDPHIRTKTNQFFSYTNQRIYHVGSSVYPPSAPLQKASVSFNSELLGSNYFEWDDKRFDNYLGFMGIAWKTTYSWTNDPDVNYSGWVTEVAGLIHSSKSNTTLWGTDSGVINIYVFKYKYADQPSTGWGYFPVVYMGNNKNYDLKIDL